MFTSAISTRHFFPDFKYIPIPDFPGTFAIWGASGRDDAGNLYLGVSTVWTPDAPQPSARVFQLSAGGTVRELGDVVSHLKTAGVYRERTHKLDRGGHILPEDSDVEPTLCRESQLKVHSKFVQMDDGKVYFASMDEWGEKEDGSQLPHWGSHLWAYSPESDQWEHLHQIPEAMIAVSGVGRYLFALGYFDHTVYVYDTVSGQLNRTQVGSVGGHISRNLISDRHGNVFVPRVAADSTADSGYVVELVQLDHELNEISSFKLDHYPVTPDFSSHGLTGLAFLTGDRIAFTTSAGFLYLIKAESGEPAEIEAIGWFHPDGESYAASLFPLDGERFLCGAVKYQNREQWVSYDLESRTSVSTPLEIKGVPEHGMNSTLLYGSNTRVDDGSCFVVGAYKNRDRSRQLPLCIKAGFPQSTKKQVDLAGSRLSGSAASKLASQFRTEEILSEFVDDNLRHWLRASPTDNGFLHPNLGEDWERTPADWANGTSQGRGVTVLCEGALATREPGFVKAAVQSANFLLERFGPNDQREHWCVQVSPKGQALSDGHNTYDAAFIILGLSRAFEVTGDPRYLSAARNCRDEVLAHHAHPDGGLYWKLNRDFENTAGLNQNPIMHFFEACLSVHEASGDPSDLDPVTAIGEFVLSRLVEPNGNHIPEYYEMNWNPTQDGYIDLGHQFEWAWLLSQAHHQGCEKRYLDVGQQVLDYGLQIGYDNTEGGIFAGADYGSKVTNRGKGLWQQTECLRAMVRYACQHGREDLWPKIDQSWELLKREFADEQYGGFVSHPGQRQKGSVWKCGYHETGLYKEILLQLRLSQ
ncbi:AGE family epimerase/isomerase [Stieleria neptunia]|uniref:AGE family epimerase/isomerase n=1 Tax=Stieleria neptunia TaxID=2527979 RepID=UPI0018D26678|nr:AGE family epimerase/isomerase [Stieleria neptunia]